MRIGLLLNWIGLSALIFALGADPATQPASAPDLTPRQQDLLLQLSDAEANIQAINKALKITGYSVGVAYDKIDSNLKGNELMNRQGGGPVRWDEFYGKTANDYPRTGFWDDRMDDHRPQQFKFIYKANNDQIAQAKDQIASLLQNQQALLDRRRVHEEDQSRLWATLAWEQIKDREIEFRPLYRFALKPAGPDAAVLAPVILFLRTAASVANDGLDSIQADQSATFQSGSRRMDAAYTALEQSLADALDGSDLKPDQAREGQALKALCKELAEQTKVVADDYANALDRDKAKEDNSKLEFRGQLQTSLSSYATEFGNLDDRITGTAAAWGISADKATLVPQVTNPVAGPAPGVGREAEPVAVAQSPPPAGATLPRASSIFDDNPPPLPPSPPSPPALPSIAPSAPSADGASARRVLSSTEKLTGDTSFDSAGGPYEIQDKLALAPGVKKCVLHVGPGAQIHGGIIPLGSSMRIEIAGTPAQPAILRQIDFQQGFGGNFKAQYAIFENCKFHKTGAWYARAGFTSKWTFDKCLIRGTTFPTITHVDYGINFTDCTFSGVTFAEISVGTPKNAALDYMSALRKNWRIIDHCRFDDCSVPPTVFWCATASDYTKCRFTGGPAFESDTATDVVAFVADTDGDAPDKIAQATPATRAALHITYAADPFAVFAFPQAK